MNEAMLSAITQCVVEGDIDSIVQSVNQAITDGIPAKTILNVGLIDGMNEVGALFKDGEMFVPEVLMSAKTMQMGIEVIRHLLVTEGVGRRGRIITATVEGDLHDIGIKLVGMMLEGAGFEVINIGVDVPATTIIEKVIELKPDIIGMSAMLTTTMVKMKDVMDMLEEHGLLNSTKVMIGGAPVSDVYANKIGAVYSDDAVSAVAAAKSILNLS